MTYFQIQRDPKLDFMFVVQRATLCSVVKISYFF